MRRRSRLSGWIAAAALTAAVVGLGLPLGGCGSGGGGGSTITVSAASSLTEAFESYGRHFPGGARFSFGASGTLAAQIRSGARPDVYAAAETELPEELHREGLVERPVAFASNRLVLAVPAKQSGIEGLADLARPGTNVVLGARGVPAGDYARELLGRLPRGEARAILTNVRSEEPDAKSIVAKLTVGAADAGLIYATDAAAAGAALRTIALPAGLQPPIAYAAAVVSGSGHPAAARRFVAGLLSGSGAAALRAAKFSPAPR